MQTRIFHCRCLHLFIFNYRLLVHGRRSYILLNITIAMHVFEYPLSVTQHYPVFEFSNLPADHCRWKTRSTTFWLWHVSATHTLCAPSTDWCCLVLFKPVKYIEELVLKRWRRQALGTATDITAPWSLTPSTKLTRAHAINRVSRACWSYHATYSIYFVREESRVPETRGAIKILLRLINTGLRLKSRIAKQ